MLRYKPLSSKWLLFAAIFIVFIGALTLLGQHSVDEPEITRAQQEGTTPTAQVITYAVTQEPAPTATPEPSATLTSEPSPTSTATATVSATATETATPAPPPPTNTPVATATAIPKAKAQNPKPSSDPNILPNGVRYGDRTPKLLNRVVRIASPDIELDTRVYEVYGTAKGAWEVADYAAGHHYTSKNPGEGGNIVLAGHNNWRGEVFRYLEFLEPGDTINVWTLDGKEYTYKVQTIEKYKEAGASKTQRLENGKVMDPTSHEQLTLITCWPYTTYTHRLVVVAMPAQ